MMETTRTSLPPTLHDRIVRYLSRERSATVDQAAEIRSYPVEERVEAGSCIDGLRFLRWEKRERVLVLECPLNVSKFRVGERLCLGPGETPGEGVLVTYLAYDPVVGLLRVEKDRWSSGGWEALDLTGPLVLDADVSDFAEGVLGAVATVFRGDDERSSRIRSILEGTFVQTVDERGRAWAETVSARFELDAFQKTAFVECIARRPFHLVQGPPGSGKTRLIASLASVLGRAGRRVLITAYTHRAVNNALRGLASIDPALGLVKLGDSHHAEDLPGAVRRARSAKSLLEEGLRKRIVVGATLFSLKAFWETAPFDLVIFDEAAQVPIPHAVCGMLSGRRYVFVGDHGQLGPIMVGDHADDIGTLSIFAHLMGQGDLQGGNVARSRSSGLDTDREAVDSDSGQPAPITARADPSGEARAITMNQDAEGGVGEPVTDVPLAVAPRYPSTLLRLTYRMNEAITRFPSRHFYEGALRASDGTASRRFEPRGRGPYDDLWDPDRPALMATIDHEGWRRRCPPEAAFAAALLEDFLVRQGKAPEEIAVVTPYRAQIRAIRDRVHRRLANEPDERTSPTPVALRRLPLIDTVERMQGQEREVVIVSLVCSEPEYAAEEANFFFSPNRLNVTLTRARTKLIVLASPRLFESLPRSLENLRRASLFARLYRELPRIDVSARCAREEGYRGA